MSESDPTSFGQNARVAIVAAVITGCVTLGTAYIKIIPEMRSNDLAKIGELSQKNARLSSQGAAPAQTMSIAGTLRSEDGAQVLVGYQVFLVPETSPMLSAYTDDNGKFSLDAIPFDSYSMIVRQPVGGKSGRAVIDVHGTELQMNGAKVAYQVKQ